MASNSNILFYLTRGNPYNDPCGMSIDQKIFGKSIGGKLFTSETLLNGQTINYDIRSGASNLFDAIVPSDIIKNNLNYRAIFIANTGTENIVLDNITINMDSNTNSLYMTDVDIAYEYVYTFGEINRNIPTEYYKPGNPSLYIDDEYDSTNKLSTFIFKKQLTSSELPTELLPNTAIKLWIRRTLIIDKTQIPDGRIDESFTITVNEYSNSISTPLQILYSKQDGRIPLSNWYDYTITNGKGNAFILRELLPKEIDLTNFNIIKTFVKEDIISIYYYTIIETTKNYFLLNIQPNDISKFNKYIQINLELDSNLLSTETQNLKDLFNISRSYYNKDDYILFWKEKINTTETNFFGSEIIYDRVTVNILHTNIWTNSISFEKVLIGYDNRRIINHNLTENKIIRKYIEGGNIEQFDDLFIMFTKDTKNNQILNISDINLNKNQLLYIFEKDILDNKYNKFNSYPGEASQVLSHRLFPSTLLTDQRPTSFNNVKNSNNTLIISNPLNIDPSVDSLRTVKILLDGTRYIDFNSIHTKEFKLKNSFVTYELPSDIVDLNNLLITSCISINNDQNIYADKKNHFTTSNIINNEVDGVIYDKPWFQNNIIDNTKINSLSIPLEWADRNYKDEWINIVASLPKDNISQISIYYNFYRNLFKTVYYDENNIQHFSIYDSFNKNYYTSESGGTTGTTGTTGSSGTSGEPTGKQYYELKIYDLSYIFEPSTYQPFSIKLYVKQISTSLYTLNYKFYFKNNLEPIFDITTKVNNISYLSYMLINPNKTFNMKINCLSVIDSTESTNIYYIKNIHTAYLNELDIVISPEKQVNKQIFSKQSDFKYYRKINIYDIDNTINEEHKELIIPIILYGNGFKNDKAELYSNLLSLDEFNTLTLDDFNTLKLSKNYRLLVDNPFDFSKMNINDKSIRFYYDSAMSKPLNFKIYNFDYQKDYVVLWVKLPDYTPETKQLYMFYGKVDSYENKSEYLNLKNNLYQNKYLGVWNFENIIFDERISFATGKIFNAGEPMVYEKTSSGELRLNKIEKEYMYGVAKVYKSHKFNMELEVPAEESLFFDESTKTQFVDFIKQTVNLLKPSYTHINEIKQYGFDVLESGSTIGGNMGQTTNKRVSGLVALTPNSNVNTYYDRIDENRFNLLTSFNGFSKNIDWVIAKPIDTKLFKAGTLKINGKIKSETIKFDTPFKNTDYFVFLANPANQKVYWQLICNNRFSITSSHYLSKEVAWMAFHRDMFGGVYTPNSIFVGKRIITGNVETPMGESPTVANMPVWYNNEIIIKPEIAIDGDPGSMTIDMDVGYSLLLSCNENINIYWTEKLGNQFRVKTSAPISCTIHWAVIKKGIEWWQELT